MSSAVDDRRRREAEDLVARFPRTFRKHPIFERGPPPICGLLACVCGCDPCHSLPSQQNRSAEFRAQWHAEREVRS